MRTLVLSLFALCLAPTAVAADLDAGVVSLAGTWAGQDLQQWLDTQADPDGARIALPSVTGGQSRRADDGERVAFHVDGGGNGAVEIGDDWALPGDGAAWGSENYWVNIVLPDGEVVTINCSSERFSSDGDVYETLVSDGRRVIREWFEDGGSR